MNEDGIVYVIDTETTGLIGYPYDLVLDIGVVRVDLFERTVTDAFDSIVYYDTDDWPERMLNCWAFQNTQLSLEMIKDKGVLSNIVSKKLRELLKGQIVTSYNVEFDFNRFLYYPPWRLKDNCIIGDCIMLSAAECEYLPKSTHDNGKWPRLLDAYMGLVDGDPAGIEGKQDHLALSDSRVAGWVLIELYRMGYWSPPEKTFKETPIESIIED